VNDFVHLHLHTEYSLLDGACHLDELVGQAAKMGQKAMAITDHGNMFGAVAFHDYAVAKGVKPILGCEIYVAPGSRYDKAGTGISEAYNHLTLLATSEVGYHNLVRLVSKGYLEGFYHRPRIDKDILAQYSEGLVGLSGCLTGEVAGHLKNGNDEGALQAVGVFRDIFGPDRFYLELMDHGIEEQSRVNRGLLRLQSRTGLPLVATNDAHYLHKDDHQAHDVLVCIGSGKKVHEAGRLRFDTNEFYVKSAAEMAALFPDHLEALANTVKIAEMTDFKLKPVSEFPKFEVPEGHTIESWFEQVTRDGFEDRCKVLRPLAEAGRLRYPLTTYAERLDKEIGVIRRVGFAGYFLIVWDFIRYAKEKGVPVGPGRGSAAGSLVAYSLRITDIDPIEYDLIFERFLNEERISPPDVDIDFCENRRGEVIEYVTRKYGRDNVAQIITFGTMKAKAVIRDVARVLDMSYADADKIAKMIPFDLKMTLDKALEESPPLKEAYDKDPKVKELVDISRRLEGTTRHASVHAAGVVISPRPLIELVPLARGTGEAEVTTQYDMKGVERIGLLKMDFLGLRTLTLIDNCVKMVEARSGHHIDIDHIPLDDARTYELFTQGKTSGLFQFESEGMRDILKRFKPDRLEHLTALNALYRPGPMQMIDDFIKRRHGQTRLVYDHPLLESILGDTYGVMVYQEQVMRIASVLAGYTLGEADILRKAMGKKNAAVMATQKAKFLEGCQRNGVAEKKANKIWDQMEQFAGYGFNKSHSAAYAWLAYQTAYLKANFRAYFMAALLTSERANTEKMVEYIGSAKDMGLAVLPPDVNASDMFFSVVGDNDIRFGLSAIKNVGEGAVEAVLRQRTQGGPFKSLFEFCERVDFKAVNRRVIESFIKSGTFDSLDKRRASLNEGLDRAMEAGQKKQRDDELGQGSLFGMLGLTGGGAAAAGPAERVREVADWPEAERLAYEKESLGFFVSGHPLERFEAELRQWANTTVTGLPEKNGQEVAIGGIVTAFRLLKTKKGDRMCTFVLEDTAGGAEVLVFPKTFEQLAGTLANEQVVLVKGKAECEEDSKPRILASEVAQLEQARTAEARHLTVRVPATRWASGAGDRLRDILDAHRGECTVTLQLAGVPLETGTLAQAVGGERMASLAEYDVIVSLPMYHRARPAPTLLAQVEELFGAGCVSLSRTSQG
jgi:DNA polymerase-3 subunit alpha